jgi:hypothetical protein
MKQPVYDIAVLTKNPFATIAIAKEVMNARANKVTSSLSL